MESDLAWPLRETQALLVQELATLVARGGAWRLLRAPVVAADPAHYPDAWDGTRAGLARVVARTLWHAHVTLGATINDVRRPGAAPHRRLRATELELTRAGATSFELALIALGNDDVAGAVAHEVGRAFVGALGDGGHPFRAASDGLPAREAGSLATVYLGLGVVAVNAAHHARSAGEVIGNSSEHEHGISQFGGLSVDDLAFLLAVQATVRDDVLPALETLRPSQAALVAAWREVLDDHEAELRGLLGITEHDLEGEPLSRPAAPVAVAVTGELDERDLSKYNHGQPVFRVPVTHAGLYAGSFFAIGFVVAFIVLAIWHSVRDALLPVAPALALLVATPTLALLVGYGLGRTRRRWRCATCRSFLSGAAACGNCGGWIAGDIARYNDRLAREEELLAELAARGPAAPLP